MAKKQVMTVSRDTVKILNAIRNSNPNIKAKTMAVGSAEGIKAFGEAVTSSDYLRNEFLTELANRIGLVIITSKMYTNPIAKFKKGMLEYGERVEEIYVNLVKGIKFNSEDPETTVFKKHKPDVKALFHQVNLERMYPSTIEDVELRKAFLSAEGVYDLISGIITAIYKSSEIDEFNLMKYMIAKAIIDGRVKEVAIPFVTKESASDVATIVKKLSNDLVFANTNYNHSGVVNFTEKASQNLLLTSHFDAYLDVNVLASAFNIDKVEFMGQRLLIDNLSEFDDTTLWALVTDYVPFTTQEKAVLERVQGVIVDEEYFQIYDTEVSMREIYNPKGLYTNMFYHIWQVMSTSNFAQAVALIESVTDPTPATAE